MFASVSGFNHCSHLGDFSSLCATDPSLTSANLSLTRPCDGGVLNFIRSTEFLRRGQQACTTHSLQEKVEKCEKKNNSGIFH